MGTPWAYTGCTGGPAGASLPNGGPPLAPSWHLPGPEKGCGVGTPPLCGGRVVAVTAGMGRTVWAGGTVTLCKGAAPRSGATVRETEKKGRLQGASDWRAGGCLARDWGSAGSQGLSFRRVLFLRARLLRVLSARETSRKSWRALVVQEGVLGSPCTFLCRLARCSKSLASDPFPSAARSSHCFSRLRRDWIVAASLTSNDNPAPAPAPPLPFPPPLPPSPVPTPRIPSSTPAPLALVPSVPTPHPGAALPGAGDCGRGAPWTHPRLASRVARGLGRPAAYPLAEAWCLQWGSSGSTKGVPSSRVRSAGGA